MEENKPSLSNILNEHGYSVAFGYCLFRFLGNITGWGVSSWLAGKTGLKDNLWVYDARAGKTTPRAQDFRVYFGMFASVLAFIFLAFPQCRTLAELGWVLGFYHIAGIAVYHTNILLFDDLRLEGDPRFWSFRRVFLQAFVNVIETAFIFAGLYSYHSTAPVELSRAVLWSVQGVTLNVPYEWSALLAKETTVVAIEVIWIIQVSVTILLLVVVLAQITSSMFKRREIAIDRTRQFLKKHRIDDT